MAGNCIACGAFGSDSRQANGSTAEVKIGPTSFEMKKTDFYPERDLDILLLVRNKQQP
jgi:hypothetical protein